MRFDEQSSKRDWLLLCAASGGARKAVFQRLISEEGNQSIGKQHICCRCRYCCVMTKDSAPNGGRISGKQKHCTFLDPWRYLKEKTKNPLSFGRLSLLALADSVSGGRTLIFRKDFAGIILQRIGDGRTHQSRQIFACSIFACVLCWLIR